jgi:hypothetical protein
MSVLVATAFSCRPSCERRVVSLDGEWQIAKTDGALPDVYPSTTPVPGLVDLAVPALDTIVLPSVDAVDGSNRPSYGYKSGWYWHRRTFSLPDTAFGVAQLKVYKARYHTKVYVNGQFVGENLYCFTPSYYDLKPLLRRGDNEIIIGVGNRYELPDSVPNGADYEKILYTPGIYDRVELTLSNRPYIDNVQCVPNARDGRLRVVAEIDGGDATLSYTVRDRSTGAVVASGKTASSDFEIALPDAKLWTPQTPQLYELALSTGADLKRTVFGMRSFRFDPDTRRALLNEQPYYLRGTNVCIYRFFEDGERASLPWNHEWTVRLHERFKDMNWEMARYCIGFPPEDWYDVCDSLGFMVQDEFPIWGVFNFTATQIAEEYRRWLRERWNHPCVVVWDAQNETVTRRTAEAFRNVRDLDLSNRPWENGWSEPDRLTDVVEAHPYLFLEYRRAIADEGGYLKFLFDTVRRPYNDATTCSPTTRGTDSIFPHAQIINEYGWLWLNRDGSTTTLTDDIYRTLWQGDSLNVQQRRYLYARHLALMTEYWRAHRQAAGILHFCGLAYSRASAPRGQTSDHFTDVATLAFEPEFYRYVKPAFAPVGLMLDVWGKSYPASSSLKAPVYVVNDLPETVRQDLTLTLEKDGDTVFTATQTLSVEPYEVRVVNFDVALPAASGDCFLKAETMVKGDTVFSLRNVTIDNNN